MSLRACELNGNGLNMFVCLQIRLGSWFGSFDEFAFTGQFCPEFAHV
jgi:hypothetical protein